MKRAGAALLIAAGLVVTGCGSGDSGSAAETSTATTTAAAVAPAPGEVPTAQTVAAGAPTIPLLTGNPGDLTVAPEFSSGTGSAPTELLVADIVEGTGPVAAPTDTVSVRYVGALYSDGSAFDSSWSRGPDPISFSLQQVVPGFQAGIAGMKVGGRREIVIPPELGYGSQGAAGGRIPANATLTFVVDLVGIQ